MATYIRIDDKDNVDWMAKFLDNLLAKDPNNAFLVLNYPYLVAWRDAIAQSVSTKKEEIPKTIVVEEDKEELIPPPPKKRGRPPGIKSKGKTVKRTKKVDVDPFSCPFHKQRTFKQAPRDDCETCWNIYKKMHPIEYPQARKRFEWKNKKTNRL